MVDVGEILLRPAIDLLKQFLALDFQVFGVTLQIEDIFVFVLLFGVVLGVFAIFKHE